MQPIQPFNFQAQEIRTLVIGGQPWFVLADVCSALEISNPRNVAARLEEDEKDTVHLADGKRGNPNVTIINESGLYAVILRSDKPQAKTFRKWVTAEVLPAIRQSGSYSLVASPHTTTEPELMGRAALRAVLQELDSNAVRFEQIEQRLDETPVMGRQLGQVYELGQTLGRLIGYQQAWSRFKRHFGLASYRDLPSGQLEEALTFLRRQIIVEGGHLPDRLL